MADKLHAEEDQKKKEKKKKAKLFAMMGGGPPEKIDDEVWVFLICILHTYGCGFICICECKYSYLNDTLSPYPKAVMFEVESLTHALETELKVESQTLQKDQIAIKELR